MNKIVKNWLKKWKEYTFFDKILYIIMIFMLIIVVFTVFLGFFYEFSTQHTVEQFIDGSVKVIE